LSLKHQNKGKSNPIRTERFTECILQVFAQMTPYDVGKASCVCQNGGIKPVTQYFSAINACLKG